MEKTVNVVTGFCRKMWQELSEEYAESKKRQSKMDAVLNKAVDALFSYLERGTRLMRIAIVIKVFWLLYQGELTGLFQWFQTALDKFPFLH